MKRALLRQFPATLLGVILFLLTLHGWWQSGHYSERRLHYFGSRSAEVFTSSSLIRISVVDGYIDPHGRPRGYKQRNARGRMMIRPVAPTLRIAPAIWEMTLGFWHVLLGVTVMTGVVALFEWRALKGGNP